MTQHERRTHAEPRRLAFALFLAGVVAGSAAAQVPKAVPDASLDTAYLRAHAETRGFMLGRPVRPKPTPDGKAVLFLRAQPRVPRMELYEFDVATGETRPLLTPEQVLRGREERLSAEEKARRERMRVAVGGFTDFQLSPDGALVLVSLSGKLYVFDRAAGSVTQLETGAGTIVDPKFSPDGKRVAYVRDHDVCVFDLASRRELQVTTGGTEAVSHGLAEFVAQEEMSRFSGYWWSPDSKSIAYEEADASGVEVWHVGDPGRPEQPATAFFYPRPGKANVKVRLGVIPVAGGETVWVDWDRQRHEYLTTVRWDEHGPLTLAVQSRDQKELVLLAADPASGKTTPLLTERDEAWLNLDQDVPHWLPGGQGFLWTSEQDGGPRLELRDTAGQFVRVLVPSAAGYQGLVHVDAKSGSVIYRASTDPTQSRLFRVSLGGGEPAALAETPGLHDATFGSSEAVYVHSESLPDAMPRQTVRRADGSAIGELPSVAEEPPVVPRAELVIVETNPDRFYCSVVRPRGFNALKRYPVIVDVYGGPGSNRVRASMASRLLNQWLADRGFVVLSIDGRGTPGRGRAWERAIGQHFGSVPIADQIAGLRALGARFPEMDLERVGIVGWSFGGYMSALAVLRHPEVFQAAAAGAPVVDWLDYDTHYTERYLGLPEANTAAYAEGSLLTYAAGLKRPLLVIHGTADDNVYFRHTIKLADALLKSGREFELLPLAGMTHMVRDPATFEAMWSRVVRHFQKHLGE